ncbi:hypothetical protein HK096_008358, partial [Nowakowskiella sp. JEL0078]
TLERTPKMTQALEIRALTLCKLNRFEDALNDASQIVKLLPRSSKGYLTCGKIFSFWNNPKGAYDVYLLGVKKVPKNDPDFSELLRREEKLRNKLDLPLPDVLKPENFQKVKDISIRNSTKKKKDSLLNGKDELSRNDLNFGRFYIPPEIFRHFFEYLSLAYRCKLTRVSRCWRSFLNHNRTLWRDLDLTNYPFISNPDLSILVSRSKDQLESLTLFNATKIKLTPTNLKLIRAMRSKKFKTIKLLGMSKIDFVEFTKTLEYYRASITTIVLESVPTTTNTVVNQILRTLTNLIKFSVAHNPQISDAAVTFKEQDGVKFQNKNLEILVIRGTEISNAGIQFIVNVFPKIHFLDIENIPTLTGHALVAISNLDELEGIKATGLGKSLITGQVQIDDALVNLLSQGTRLQNLVIQSCPWISNLPLMTFWNCKLRVLDLSSCVGISDEGILGMIGVNSCRDLTVLRLSRCPKITDITVIALADVLAKIQILDVSFNPAITDKSVIAMQKMSSLNIIELAGCNSITFFGINSLISLKNLVGSESVPLRLLNLNNCSGISVDGIREIRNLWPNLNLLYRFN